MQTKCLHTLLKDTANKYPDNLVFVRRGQTLTYGELEHLTTRFAGALLEMGISPGDRVALVLENVAEYVISYYGVLKAGAVVVPLCPDTRLHTLSFALEYCQARAVILTAANAKLLDGQSEKLPLLEWIISTEPLTLAQPGQFKMNEYSQLIAANASCQSYQPPSNDAALASIIYTSGTTARPKGVMLSHHNLVANTLSIVEYLGLTASDSVALVLPFFYSYGNSLLHTHICVGGTLFAVGSMAFPAAVVKGIQDHGCTGLSGVPSTFARLVQSSLFDRFDLKCLRYITQAGGPMTPALTQKLRQSLPHLRIFVMYGQTEASARLSYLPPEKLDQKMGSIGIAIPGVTLRIMDKEGNELPRGTVGEIVASGENIMCGYWSDPEETARVLRPEGLRTGDLARMDEDGFIYIVGRESDMIKSGAHRIGPKEIEDVIELLPEVAQCAVVGVPDELLGEAIAAFIVPVENTPLTETQVLRICHEHLPRFKMPGYVLIVQSLPRTPSGKVRRNELKDWFANSITTQPKL
jgi:acyl-CoA synthetase (AMP-forming)/AMP-acid ligase II